MTLSTPNEVYDSENASRLLTSVGEDSVTTAMRDMLENGVLSRVVRDPKRAKPGRMLKISESSVCYFHTFDKLTADAHRVQKSKCTRRFDQ